ncbi:MAG: alpha/beta hydrolase family protein [Arenicella sp.]
MRYCSTILLSIAAIVANINMAFALELPGYDRIQVEAQHRVRAMEAAIWYPADRKGYKSLVGDSLVFKGTEVYQGPAVKAGSYPLVILSHGSGSNVDNMGWLAGSLAVKGSFVAGVNHPGSTTGDSSPRRSANHWERAKDISALIDSVLSDPVFGHLVDRSRISVIGFSLGGHTVMSVAGARLSQDKYSDYCTKHDYQTADCRFFNIAGVDFAKLPRQKFEQNLRDVRISRTVAIDPAFAYGMTKASLTKISMPVQLINLGEQGKSRWFAVDMGPEGNDLAQSMPNVEYQQILDANHFTFLALCKPMAPQLLIEEGEDPICDDPKGADRAQVHSQLISMISEFLEL